MIKNSIKREKVNNLKRLAVNITLIIIMFFCGLAVTWLPMSYKQDSIRSGEDTSAEFAQVVNIYVTNPPVFLKQILLEANNSGLIFSVKKSKEGYDLLMKGLIPSSPEQERIKKAFGIGSAASGDVLFKIRLKS